MNNLLGGTWRPVSRPVLPQGKGGQRLVHLSGQAAEGAPEGIGWGWNGDGMGMNYDNWNGKYYGKY